MRESWLAMGAWLLSAMKRNDCVCSVSIQSHHLSADDFLPEPCQFPRGLGDGEGGDVAQTG